MQNMLAFGNIHWRADNSTAYERYVGHPTVNKLDFEEKTRGTYGSTRPCLGRFSEWGCENLIEFNA